jgi:hypothetical protein
MPQQLQAGIAVLALHLSETAKADFGALMTGKIILLMDYTLTDQAQILLDYSVDFNQGPFKTLVLQM